MQKKSWNIGPGAAALLQVRVRDGMVHKYLYVCVCVYIYIYIYIYIIIIIISCACALIALGGMSLFPKRTEHAKASNKSRHP